MPSQLLSFQFPRCFGLLDIILVIVYPYICIL